MLELRPVPGRRRCRRWLPAVRHQASRWRRLVQRLGQEGLIFRLRYPGKRPLRGPFFMASRPSHPAPPRAASAAAGCRSLT
ncbi:hypothetical protein RA210_U110103 [Rubrivivax sp. A210]|nr:hypothetical protein RA210_U110103 [Rubrivivax sp. A210]